MLTRIAGASLVVAFASVANAGMVEVELIPDNAGPYYGGESLTVGVWLHSQIDYDVGLRRVQLDFTDSDPAIWLGPTFEFDYSSIPDDLGGYSATTSPDMPIPWTANTLHVLRPGMYLRVPTLGLTHIGSIAVTLPTGPTTYYLDALNADESDSNLGARLTVVPLPWPAPNEHWSAFTGEIEGDPYAFHVVPEPTTILFVILGGTVLLLRPNARSRRRAVARAGAVVAVVGLASVANAGMVEVELIPDNPGPYYGGESLTVDFWMRSGQSEEAWVRLVQFDFSDTDPLLSVDDALQFDYSTLEEPYVLGSPELPVAWAARFLDCYCPSWYLRLLPETPFHIARIGVELPQSPGHYLLDALNADHPDVDHGARLVVNAVDDWRAYTEDVTGGSHAFEVVPEPGTGALFVVSAVLLLRRGRSRTLLPAPRA